MLLRLSPPEKRKSLERMPARISSVLQAVAIAGSHSTTRQQADVARAVLCQAGDIPRSPLKGAARVGRPTPAFMDSGRPYLL